MSQGSAEKRLSVKAMADATVVGDVEQGAGGGGAVGLFDEELGVAVSAAHVDRLGGVVGAHADPVGAVEVDDVVGASLGSMRKGSLEPLVTSRMKKLVSLPAMSQVWEAKPEEPVLLEAVGRGCCRRRRGPRRPAKRCRHPTSTGGADVDGVGDGAGVRCGRPYGQRSRPEGRSSYRHRWWCRCRAGASRCWGKEAEEEVSSKWMRRLFSFRRKVSEPKLSPLLQSKPTQAELWDDEVVREDLILLKAALREIGVGDGAVSLDGEAAGLGAAGEGLVILAVAGDGGVLDEGPLVVAGREGVGGRRKELARRRSSRRGSRRGPRR